MARDRNRPKGIKRTIGPEGLPLTMVEFAVSIQKGSRCGVKVEDRVDN